MRINFISVIDISRKEIDYMIGYSQSDAYIVRYYIYLSYMLGRVHFSIYLKRIICKFL